MQDVIQQQLEKGEGSTARVLFVNDNDMMQEVERQYAGAEARWRSIAMRHNKSLAIGIPVLMIVMLAVAPFSSDFLFYTFWERDNLSMIQKVIITWSIILVAAFSFYYFGIVIRLKTARQELSDIAESLQRSKLADPINRLRYLRDRLVILTNKSAKVFIEDGRRYDKAVEWRQLAGRTLSGDDPGLTADRFSLSEAQFCLDSLNELILREQREQREQRNWQLAALFIMAIYIGGLALPVILSEYKTGEPTGVSLIPIFGIPLSVIMWGAAGSLAAILYRFYTEKDRINFAPEVRWLIARPMIGIIMSAVVYIAIVSGLILLGASPRIADQASSAPVPKGQLEVYWALAFLAGFSDKFYIGVINLLVHRSMAGEDEQEQPTTNESTHTSGRGRSEAVVSAPYRSVAPDDNREVSSSMR